jgi:hypothetical protein
MYIHINKYVRRRKRRNEKKIGGILVLMMA